jgi:hypothetical protein
MVAPLSLVELNPDMSGNFFDKIDRINPPASPERERWRAGKITRPPRLSESDGGQARFFYILYIQNIPSILSKKGNSYTIELLLTQTQLCSTAKPNSTFSSRLPAYLP